MIEQVTTKSGMPGLTVNGRHYHSAYDPEKEAIRFIERTYNEFDSDDEGILNVKAEARGVNDSCSGGASAGVRIKAGPSPQTVIVLGEGGGYLAGAVKKIFPAARCITLFYSDELFSLCGERGHVSWNPADGTNPEVFFRNQLGELDLGGLLVVEWPAAALCFPDMSRKVKDSLGQVIRELKGSLLTTIGMGRLWMRNSLLNFLHIEPVYTDNPYPENLPIAITASGPTLEKSIFTLKRFRDNLFILALPSSVPCLDAHRISPDMIIMTDPGYYSAYHLHWVKKEAVRLVMPLSAASGLRRMPFRFSFFAQPAFFEEALLAGVHPVFPKIPPQGTVAATAIQHARAASKAPLILCGLDFCYEDIRSHARPDAFDALLEDTADRFRPFHSEKFDRAFRFAPLVDKDNGTRTSRALSTYCGWFSSAGNEFSRGIYRLEPSAVPLPGISVIDRRSVGSLVAGKKRKRADHGRAARDYPSFSKRKKRICDLLAAWRAMCRLAESRIKKTRSLSALFTDTEMFHLFYFLDLRHLSSIKRAFSVNNEHEALETALSMCRDTDEFLEALHRKLLEAGRTD
ncbi:MAG: DUF115 domain-containing protein [Spirochaetales bacterium]|nr:DUF115 domain-containing protein [Spirochaetales bacterium]